MPLGHIPGILYSILGEFATRNLNLADLEGHRGDTLVKEALSGLESEASMPRILGSYPRYADQDQW